MKEYMHNGEKVVLQTVIDRCFIDALNEKGIFPEELPIDNFEIRVFKYSIDGVKRYACVKAYGREDYFEDIYITYAVPEDGFERMMYDVEAQARAESFLQPNKNGWYSFPVDGDQYWTIGTSKGKYGEFAKINGTIFSVNSAGCMYAKAGTEKGELFVKAIRSLIEQMKKEIEARAIHYENEEEDD